MSIYTYKKTVNPKATLLALTLTPGVGQKVSRDYFIIHGRRPTLIKPESELTMLGNIPVSGDPTTIGLCEEKWAGTTQATNEITVACKLIGLGYVGGINEVYDMYFTNYTNYIIEVHFSLSITIG